MIMVTNRVLGFCYCQLKVWYFYSGKTHLLLEVLLVCGHPLWSHLAFLREAHCCTMSFALVNGPPLGSWVRCHLLTGMWSSGGWGSGQNPILAQPPSCLSQKLCPLQSLSKSQGHSSSLFTVSWFSSNTAPRFLEKWINREAANRPPFSNWLLLPSRDMTCQPSSSKLLS